MIRFALLASVLVLTPGLSAQTMTKAVVGEKIRQVENGVDEFREYLNQRGENARSTASTAQAQGRGKRRTATESQQATATAKKDELDDALGRSQSIHKSPAPEV